MARIAGHSFDLRGFCTDYVTEDGGYRICGRRWLDIRHCDITYVGETGWSRTGKLNIFEVNQIIAQKEKEDAIFDSAINNKSDPSLSLLDTEDGHSNYLLW